ARGAADRACTELVCPSGSGRHSRDKPSPRNDPGGTGGPPETNREASGYYVPLRSTRTWRSAKGDPDVQPEPEPGPAEPEPGSETRPAAGRRPEARPTAAGPEPPG